MQNSQDMQERECEIKLMFVVFSLSLHIDPILHIYGLFY